MLFRRSLGKCREVFLRQPGYLELLVDDEMSRFTLGQQLAIAGAQNFMYLLSAKERQPEGK